MKVRAILWEWLTHGASAVLLQRLMPVGFICHVQQLPGLQITPVELLQVFFSLLNFSGGSLGLQTNKQNLLCFFALFFMLDSFLSGVLAG